MNTAATRHPRPPRTGVPSQGPFVTAVIPVYNNAQTVGPLLDSLLGQTVAADEVVVVDDASTDNTPDLVSAHPIGARLVRLAQNSGPSVARNAGIEAARDMPGGVILFLDSDVWVDPGAVAETKSVFCDESVQAINGIMLPPPLNPSWATWYKCLVEHAWAYFAEQWDGSSNCINTRIGAARRAALLQVGGFDPRYRKPCVEDHEFGMRFARVHAILLDRNLCARHHFSGVRQTIRNYWKRTADLLELLWSVPGASTDKGGASSSSVRDFLLGAATWGLFALSPLTGPWPVATVGCLFAISSRASLRFCRQRGPAFYAYCLLLHSIYGVVTTLSGAMSLGRRLSGRLGPVR